MLIASLFLEIQGMQKEKEERGLPSEHIGEVEGRPKGDN